MRPTLLESVIARLIAESAAVDGDELRRQLTDVRDGTTPEARALAPFVLGDAWKQKVHVDPDERLIRPGYRHVFVNDPRVSRAYPDLVFVVNFLAPWLTMMSHRRKPDWPRISSYLRSVGRMGPSRLFRFQRVDFDDPIKKELEAAARELRAPECEFSTRASDQVSYTWTAEAARKAAYGAGVFGEYDAGFLYRIDGVTPYFDVTAFSTALVAAAQGVLGKVPPLLDGVDTYGTREDEVIGPSPARSLEFGKDVLAFKAARRYLTINDVTTSRPDVKELAPSNGKKTFDGAVKMISVTVATLRRAADYLKDDIKSAEAGRLRNGLASVRWMSTGGGSVNETSHEATLVPKNPRDVPNPELSELVGRDVYLYHF